MSFAVSGDAYDRFMGRYSAALAAPFADFGGVEPGQTAVDVGCGSGVLTEELARRLGADQVGAADPSPLLAACAARVPGADARQASAEALPWPDDAFDAALAQLVVHFMKDPPAGAREMRRVTRPGGTVAACVWDFRDGGMRLLHVFWQSARALDPRSGSESSRFGDPTNLERLWRDAGLDDVETRPLAVSSRYEDFDEVWDSFLGGVGPAGQYAASLPPDKQAALREEYRRRLGDPEGSFTLQARAWAVRGRVPRD